MNVESSHYKVGHKIIISLFCLFDALELALTNYINVTSLSNMLIVTIYKVMHVLMSVEPLEGKKFQQLLKIL